MRTGWPAIAELREVGKKEAAKRLAALGEVQQ